MLRQTCLISGSAGIAHLRNDGIAWSSVSPSQIFHGLAVFQDVFAAEHDRFVIGRHRRPPSSGETLFGAVFRKMQVMGVNALDRAHPLEKFLREAAVFPLYDAGNIGMQMRKIWGVMLDEDFDPRAIADSRPMPFKKSMEGVGTLAATGKVT